VVAGVTIALFSDFRELGQDGTVAAFETEPYSWIFPGSRNPEQPMWRHQVYDYLHAARQAMPGSESIPSRDARRRGEYQRRESTILAGAPAAVVCPWPRDCPPKSDKTFSHIYVLSSRPSAIDSATFTTGC